jgi:cation diffusion facilitator CzcD-associated flavoprotein CzcO
MTESADGQLDYDVCVIGAGIAGIGFAYRLQERMGKDLKYCVLESRHELGGTWSLFQYPGRWLVCNRV